ncbi:DUF3772 domain-containing protein [Celeribacter indicus]|uniref:Mechanosensitive ion channel protein MscS n=1 Tax=Celeribacter indicus TaxID=1208324 RepID=A0A0B5DSE8_9RHOB|nr:DUF3772 domain-containing protein [Celeribacter indicus]AJE46463.1 mechanosensitive ion channel protein MscS [Celeribacter indicus]SDW57354.1 Small-conductance mechanosensitive channel [Celeribacter indicus]
MIRHLLARLVLILCLCLPLSLSAQGEGGPDYAGWESFAEAAEDRIDDRNTENADLEAIRAELVEWRLSFEQAQTANASRIQTLEAQMEALGPAPEDGTVEPRDVAERRSALRRQIESARAPVRSAEEAYTRADGLIGEIDGTLLDRQADALTELGPSPLNPTLWPEAARALADSAVAAWTTISDNLASPENRATLRANAVTILIYLVVALVLVARGPRWSDRMTEWVRRRVSGEAGKGVTGFLASLGEIVVPLAGLVALLLAARVSGLLGDRALVAVAAIPQIGLIYLFWRWIAGRLFYPTGAGEPILDLGSVRRREATMMGALAGTMSVFDGRLSALAEIDGYSTATVAVLSFPLVAIAAGALFRLARILAPATPPADGAIQGEMAEDHNFAYLVLRTITRIVLVASVVAVVLAAAGYMTAAKAIVFPLLRSLGLLGFVAVLSRLGYDLYALVTRRPDGARDALVPVLLSFCIVTASIPFFLLIWGVREDQLFELWATLRAGVTLGGVKISPSNFFTFVLVFAIGLGITRLFKTGLRSTVLPKTKIDKGGQNAIVAGAGYVGIFLAAIVAIVAAGIDLSALAIVAGALSVGIGFGLQNIVQNFVSGIILLIERPISEGDWIDVGNGQMGFVRDISVRSTRVETFDKTDLIVPNADLISNQVTNYTRGNLIGRVIVPVGVAYGTDTRKVERILREIAEDQPMVSMNPAPQVLFMSFGADALEFEIRAILRDVTFVLAVKNDINHAIAQRFAEEGIEIPFAQRDIWLRNPEALGGRGTEPVPEVPAVPPSQAATVSQSDRLGAIGPEDMPDGGAGDEGETT